MSSIRDIPKFILMNSVSAIKRGTRTASHSESADEDEVEQETRPDSQRSEYVIVPSSQPSQREEPSSTQPSPGPSDQAKSGGGTSLISSRFV